MSITKKILLSIALLVGLFVRLYRLDSPVADWHSHRQADTASVTANFIKYGIDLLHPKYHDLSNVQSGLENPYGYRMVEFPIYNLVSTSLHFVFHSNIDVSSRIVSIIFSLAGALLIFLICFRLTKLFTPSFFAMLYFLFLPFNIYYSRTILPEPTAVFFMLLSLFIFRTNIILSGISLALAILIKPYTAIILFPTLLLLAWQQYHKLSLPRSILYLLTFALISLIPFVLWRFWIGQFPEGIPKSDWLLNNSDSTTFPNWFRGYDLTFLNKLIAFRPHWFHWLFKERIANLIMGTFGVIPLFLGLAYKKNLTQKFSFSLIFGILLYFVIVAQGNIQHDYYQVLIVPSLSILSGLGTYYIYQYLFSSQRLSLFLILTISILSFYFSSDLTKGYYQINHPTIVAAGVKTKEILPQNSLVVAPYTGDTAFLYQTGFSGWPVEIYDIDNLVKKFPSQPIYLTAVNFDQYTNSVISKYPTIFRNNDFVILKLSP